MVFNNSCMISKTTFYEIPIPIPSLDEQQKIVEFCKSQEEKIRNINELMLKLQKTIDESGENSRQFLELMLQWNPDSSVWQAMELHPDNE